MDIEVLLFGRPRECAGISQDVVSIQEGAKLVDFMRLLKIKYGPAFSREVSVSKKPIILVNGRNIDSLEGEKTKLTNGDTVAVLPMTFGG